MTTPEIEAEHIHCPLCGKQKERVLLTGRDRLHGIEGEFTLVQCQECALIYLNPQPALETLSRYYPENRYGPHLPRRRKKNGPPKPLGYGLKRLWIRAIARFRSLGPDTRVLDVGCGNGAFLYALVDETIPQEYWEGLNYIDSEGHILIPKSVPSGSDLVVEPYDNPARGYLE